MIELIVALFLTVAAPTTSSVTPTPTDTTPTSGAVGGFDTQEIN